MSHTHALSTCVLGVLGVWWSVMTRSSPTHLDSSDTSESLDVLICCRRTLIYLVIIYLIASPLPTLTKRTKHLSLTF